MQEAGNRLLAWDSANGTFAVALTTLFAGVGGLSAAYATQIERVRSRQDLLQLQLCKDKDTLQERLHTGAAEAKSSVAEAELRTADKFLRLGFTEEFARYQQG